MCGPGGGASDDGVIVGAGDGDGDGLLVRAALVIEDLDGEGVGDLLSVGEVLDDGGCAVGAVIEGVGPLTGVSVECQ